MVGSFKESEAKLNVFVGNSLQAIEVSIHAKENFDVLKKRVLDADDDESIDPTHHVVVFAFKSSVRVRSMHIPDQNAPVLASITDAEKAFPGEVLLVITSLLQASSIFVHSRNDLAVEIRSRTNANAANAKLQRDRKDRKVIHTQRSVEEIHFEEEEEDITEPHTSPRLVNIPEAEDVVTSADPTPAAAAAGGHVDGGLSQSQAILWELMENSLKHGPLTHKRYAIGAKLDEERLYAILDAQRLWFFSLSGASVTGGSFETHPDMAHVSYVDLPHNIIVAERGADSATFVLSNLGDTHAHDPEKRSLHFRACDTRDKDDWLRAFQTSSQLHDQNISIVHWENESFLESEREITEAQLKVSEGNIEQLAANVTFEGMLGNGMIREHFQAYLKTHIIHETMMFWEQAEDYRRSNAPNAHANAPEPLSLGPSYTAAEKQRWAESIFDTFIRDGATQQIDDCSREEEEALLEILNRTKHGGPDGHSYPPADLFAELQARCLKKLKYNEGHYISFVMIDQYRHILMASLHAEERRAAGLLPLATTLSDNRELPSKMGIMADFVDCPNEAVACLFQESAWETKTISSKLFGGVFGSSTKSENTEQDDGRQFFALDTTGNFIRNTPWRLKNHSICFPSWWWTFIDVEGLPREGGALPLITSAGLNLELLEKSLLLKEIKVIISNSVVRYSERANASYNVRSNINADGSDPIPAATTCKCSSVIGHPSLRRISFVERSVMNYGAAKVQRTGLYGTVMLTGILKYHHVVTPLDTPATVSTIFGERRNAAFTYVGNAPSLNLSVSTKTSIDSATTVSSKPSVKASGLYKLEFKTHFTALTEFFGKGRLLLFDAGSNVLVRRLRLECITEIGISHQVMNGIELYEGYGEEKHCSVLFVVRGVVYEDPCRLAQRWIDHILPYCAPDCIANSYIHYGVLNKRGVTNSSYKSRFFILTSVPSLIYYKDTTGRMSENVHGSSYKGEIFLESAVKGDIVREYMKPNVQAALPDLSIQTPGRVFHVQAEDLRSAALWYNKLLEAIGESTDNSDIG